jgi:glutathione S-transferase
VYPDDPAERRRALELEDYFDEQLGPHTRLLAVHHMLGAPEVTLGAFFPDVGGPGRRALRAAFPLVRAAMVRRLGIGERSVALAYERLEAAAERFRCELQPSGYLVGERFSVADLTLAALLAPLVAPREYPYLQPQRRHPLFAPPRELLSRAALLDWTRAMYSRHRGYSAEMPATEARREPVEPAETLAVAGGAKR